jgi:polynucleotide 5'-hydroxyl-kinase GRC3/NOL9
MSELRSISPGRDWDRVLARLERGTVLVVGPAGSGKTTLARWLVGQLSRALGRVALVDADPGQSTVGVPGCLGLALTGPWEAPAGMWFVGSTSPGGHLLPAVVGAARLAERARNCGAEVVVVDAPGMVDGGVARVLHHHLAHAVGVDQVVAIQGDDGDRSMDPLLALLQGVSRRVDRLAPAAGARERSREERRAYREGRFAAHLQGARTRLFSPRRIVGREWLPARPGELAEGTVLGLLDGSGFCLGLGLVTEVHRDRVAVRTAVSDVPVVRLVTGSFRLDPEGREIPE